MGALECESGRGVVRAELGDALSYEDGNVFTFKPGGGRDSDVQRRLRVVFMPTFSFCKMNEGATRRVATFRASTTHGWMRALQRTMATTSWSRSSSRTMRIWFGWICSPMRRLAAGIHGF